MTDTRPLPWTRHVVTAPVLASVFPAIGSRNHATPGALAAIPLILALPEAAIFTCHRTVRIERALGMLDGAPACGGRRSGPWDASLQRCSSGVVLPCSLEWTSRACRPLPRSACFGRATDTMRLLRRCPNPLAEPEAPLRDRLLRGLDSSVRDRRSGYPSAIREVARRIASRRQFHRPAIDARKPSRRRRDRPGRRRSPSDRALGRVGSVRCPEPFARNCGGDALHGASAARGGMGAGRTGPAARQCGAWSHVS